MDNNVNINEQGPVASIEWRWILISIRIFYFVFSARGNQSKQTNLTDRYINNKKNNLTFFEVLSLLLLISKLLFSTIGLFTIYHFTIFLPVFKISILIQTVVIDVYQPIEFVVQFRILYLEFFK